LAWEVEEAVEDYGDLSKLKVGEQNQPENGGE